MAWSTMSKIWVVDCETDPFLYGRIPQPFIWGAFDGAQFLTFSDTEKFIEWIKTQKGIFYAHNGGKFDFIYLLDHFNEGKPLIINSRIVEAKLGLATLRDSYSIIPLPLAKFQKTKIEYWKFEKPVRRFHMAEITRYLRDDCLHLFELVTTFRQTAGTKATIAASALAFAKNIGISVGKTNTNFDDVFRPFYHGGRTQVFRGGKHKTGNVYDIKSAYPFAMLEDHPQGRYFVVHNSLEKVHNVGRAFIELVGYSDGAFPVFEDNTLSFPKALRKYQVTGWEYLTAKKHGLLLGERITRVFEVENKINFRPYVEHWFDVKNRAEKAGDKATRMVAKLMLNSLYGKFAQNPRNFTDWKIRKAGSVVGEGWSLNAEYDKIEFHTRPTSDRYTTKKNWERFPLYHNVATAASITGYTRALLLDAIHTVGAEHVYYTDTDCLFVAMDAKTHNLRQDGKIGAWEWEGMFGPLILTGKKQYALKFVNGPSTGTTKIVCKGARLRWKDFEALLQNKTVEWKNDAPTFSLAMGQNFVYRRINQTYN